MWPAAECAELQLHQIAAPPGLTRWPALRMAITGRRQQDGGGVDRPARCTTWSPAEQPLWPSITALHPRTSGCHWGSRQEVTLAPVRSWVAGASRAAATTEQLGNRRLDPLDLLTR